MLFSPDSATMSVIDVLIVFLLSICSSGWSHVFLALVSVHSPVVAAAVDLYFGRSRIVDYSLRCYLTVLVRYSEMRLFVACPFLVVISAF